MTVAKNVRAMWEAFHGRATVYDEALDASDPAAMTSALARNVWRGGEAPGAPALAAVAVAQMARLNACSPEELVSGRFRFAAAVPA